MTIALKSLTAGLAALALAGPALADDGRWDRHDRHDNRRDWRDTGNARSDAYRKGYRDGMRADDRYERRQDWRYANDGYAYRPAYDSRRYRPDNRDPAYRGAAYGNRSYQGSPYWWGSNGQVHCRRQDGTAGLVVGALAGGTLGNVIAREGDKRLGSVIGGTLGAVLGNELAKGNVRCR